MYRDRRSTPARGRRFPLRLGELARYAASFPRHTGDWMPDRRIHAQLRNCLVETAYGHLLCTYKPMSYLVVFSLPDHIPTAHGRRVVEAALQRFQTIDLALDHLRYGARSVVLYRAFLGPLATLTITRHVMHFRGRGWGFSQRASLAAITRRQRACRSQDIVAQTTLSRCSLWK